MASERSQRPALANRRSTAVTLRWPESASADGRFVARHGRLIVTTPPEGRKIQQLYTTPGFPAGFRPAPRVSGHTQRGQRYFHSRPAVAVSRLSLAGPFKNLQNYRPGDWNEIEVTVKGDLAHCLCNGEVLDAAMKIPSTGSIGFEGDRGQLEYRRIRIRELP